MTRGTITVLVAVAVAAGSSATALAGEPSDDRTRLPKTAAEQSSTPTRPDDRAGRRGPGAIAAVRPLPSNRPDDHAGTRAPGQLGVPSSSSPSRSAVAAASEAFDWADAAMGAIGGLGAALTAGGLVLVAARLRGSRHASL
jgi:hypothetical protein